MSKVDGPRAIREARHAAYRAAQNAARTVRAASPAAAEPATPAEPAESVESVEPVEPADKVETPKPTTRKKASKGATAHSEAPAPDGGAAPAESGTDDLCGHRSMNGRSCRRPAGHAEKSHRYS